MNGNQTKLESAGSKDSAFVDSKDDDTGNIPHPMDTASGAPKLPVPDTQPHSGETPPMASSVPILPETKRMAQENKDLQAELAEKSFTVENLKKELRQAQVEKDVIQITLNEKERELQAVKEQMNNDIQALKVEIEKLKDNKTHLAEKEKEIERLRKKEEKYQNEIDELKEAKHKLDLKIQKMESDLKFEIQSLKEQLEHTKQQTRGQVGVHVNNRGLGAFIQNVGPITMITVTAFLCITAFGITYLVVKNKK